MSVLESEVKKYLKKDFTVRQKRTLKQGKRIILIKKKGGLGGVLGEKTVVYLYSPKGDSDTRAIREFLKDYKQFYKKYDFDEGDKAVFLSSGEIDKGLFRDLKKALVRDKDILHTIKTKTLPKMTLHKIVAKKSKRIVEEERIRERITEREITRRRISEEHISVRGVLKAIRDVPFIKSKKEKGYEKQLYQYLFAKNYTVLHESSRRGARFDLVLGNNEVAVELKIIKSSSDFRPLIGQIIQYRDQFKKIIVVLIDRFGNPSVMKQEIKRIEGLSRGNIKVIVK